MTDDRDLRVAMARREDHIDPGTPEREIDAAMARVERARNWAERMDNEYNYRLKETLPEVDLDTDVEAALDELAGFVAEADESDLEEDRGEAIQGEIYETAKRNGVEVGEFFAAGYQLLFGKDQGPRLGPFLAALDTAFVVDRLRREG
jgi:lysyl-tRNA synthetase class 1